MSSITCGNCKQTHHSVEAVRACYRAPKPEFSSNIAPLFPIDAPPSNRDDVFGMTRIGYYQVGADIYRVTPARSSKRTFAHKMFVLMNGNHTWKYQGLASSIIPSGTPPLTAAEVAAFGKAAGRCLLCGRLLTDTQSIAAGIGPVCAKRLAA